MQDFLLEGMDLTMENGDLVVGESDRQHQVLLLRLEKGELRATPTRGVGIQSWVLSENPAALNAAVKREFQRDGMRLHRVRTVAGQPEIHATYE
jgi:hypothetical protein